LQLLSDAEPNVVSALRYKLFLKLTHLGFYARMEDERYLKLLYRAVTGRPLHLDPPVLFSEKVQWLKLNDKNPIYPQFCDKIAVREFVRGRIGDEHLIAQYGIWDDPDRIDFSALPNRFVLKCTHDSGSAIVCRDRASFDIDAAKRLLKKRLRKDYSIAGREWPYHLVPRRVIAEEFIGGADSSAPDDYKFYCVRGKMLWVCICTNRRQKDVDYYLVDREYRPFWTSVLQDGRPCGVLPAMPPRFAEMIALSEQLAEGFLHVRVDLYDTQRGIRFGEMTLYDQSGFIPEYTEEFDRLLGGLVNLQEEAPESAQARADALDKLRNLYLYQSANGQ